VSLLADNLARVRDRIAAAALSAGRPCEDVLLLAVSKGKPVEMIREAYALGQQCFGESYAQELAEKAKSLADCPDLTWHFIGHLQSNKARVVAPIAQVVHTVDSASLARELGRRAQKALPEDTSRRLSVLIEVNVAREPQKSGVSPEGLPQVLDAVLAEPSLLLRGLMTVPPVLDLLAATRAFEALASLQEAHGGARLLPELSMGMSHDLEVAVAAGATIVRIGTAIFGPR
jgi:pyridoxal phosphate enzyme (YggS family)